jgi:hypothetical protein
MATFDKLITEHCIAEGRLIIFFANLELTKASEELIMELIIY